jgi:hypothetical protein
MSFQEDQTFTGAPTPFGGNIKKLVRELFPANGSVAVGNLRLDRLSKLKQSFYWNPIELQSGVSNNELHNARLHQLTNGTLVKIPDAFTGYRTYVIPISVRGIFVTVRWSGLTVYPLHPRMTDRIYRDCG